jgi:hypothetical protein
VKRVFKREFTGDYAQPLSCGLPTCRQATCSTEVCTMTCEFVITQNATKQSPNRELEIALWNFAWVYSQEQERFELSYSKSIVNSDCSRLLSFG